MPLMASGFLDHRVMHFRQSQCIERSLLVFRLADTAAYLRDFYLCHVVSSFFKNITP